MMRVLKNTATLIGCLIALIAIGIIAATLCLINFLVLARKRFSSPSKTDKS